MKTSFSMYTAPNVGVMFAYPMLYKHWSAFSLFSLKNSNKFNKIH